MKYTDVLRAMSGDHSRAAFVCRAALLPYARIQGSVPPKQVRANLLRSVSVAAIPAILDVPRRVLKRWATRALQQIPRSSRITGPRLAMLRRGTMDPSRRAVCP